MSSNNLNIKNRKAGYEYELLDKFVAGIQLSGTEIKSVRAGKASIKEAYCLVVNHEVFIRNMHIAEYKPASYNNHIPTRERKLLLNRTEINKIHKQLKTKGVTVVPLRLFLSKSGYAKIEISVAKGKKLYDKREDLKLKDSKRDMDRLNKLKF
jgi:SsrA-binding protein